MEIFKTTVSNAEENIKLFRYRWIIIFIFGFCSIANYAQFMQFTIIGDVIKRYYRVGYFLVNMTDLIFLITFLVFFIPIGYIVEKISLKQSMLICFGLNAIGNSLKYFATSSDEFYLILTSQALVSIAQIFMLVTPTKIASVWFGPKEVSTACAIGVFGTQMGEALGAVVPALMMEHTENEDIIEQRLRAMFVYNGLASIIALIIVLIFFRSKPPLPPSQSQADLTLVNDDKMSYLSAVKGFTENRDFIIVLISQGIGYGIWITFTILLNQIYTNFFPDDKSDDLGLSAFAAILCGGCFGTLIFGYIFDRVSNFKWVTFFVLLANLLSSIGLAMTFLMENKHGTLILIPIFGFFSGSLMVISYEYAIETTFPTPEAFGAAVLHVVIYIVAIFYEILLSFVFDSFGYFIGEIIIVFSLAIATFSILFISPELRRKKANLTT